MSDPCLACRVPGGCDEEHPLCGYRVIERETQARYSRNRKVAENSRRYRAKRPVTAIVAHLVWLSDRRVDRVYRAVVEAMR